MNNGFRVPSCVMRYIEKHPGKQVTLPNKLSKAFAILCEIQYSYTWIYISTQVTMKYTMVIMDCFEFVRPVSPQRPMVFVS